MRRHISTFVRDRDALLDANVKQVFEAHAENR